MKIDEHVWDHLKDEPENLKCRRNEGDMFEHEYEDDDHQDIEGNIDRFNADYIESESVENLDHVDRIDDDGELGEYESEHAYHDGGFVCETFISVYLDNIWVMCIQNLGHQVKSRKTLFILSISR